MKPTLTILMAAYNEAENIGALLSALLRQKIVSAHLAEIIVASDASTDGTDEIVRSFEGAASPVRLVRMEKRSGKNRAQSMFMERSASDIFVVLDADILPENDVFIEGLIRPLIEDASVGLSSAIRFPAKPETFTERVLAWHHVWKEKIFLSLKNGNNLYLCSGSAMAFSKRLYKTLRYPDNTPDDTMAYMFCVTKKMRFVCVKHPRAIFRCPTNLRDHAKQSARFVAGKDAVIGIFGNEARKEYAIPRGRMLKAMVKEFFRHPMYSISFFTMWFYVRVRKTGKFTSLWEVAESSKKLKT